MKPSTPLSTDDVHLLNDACDELAREARVSLNEHSNADNRQALFELVVTFSSWVGLMVASYHLAPRSMLLAAVLAAVGGLFWVRLFILQHDCGHGSLFTTAALNRKVGTVLGILTMTPFLRWKASHAAHHATSGNLSERSWSRDIYLMTVKEFESSSGWLRLTYRLYRNRFVLFFILAPIVFLVEHRRYMPEEKSAKLRRGVWITNFGLVFIFAALLMSLETARLFQVFVPFYLVGAAVGVWLFYVQHQFSHAYWADRQQYSAAAASLYGSSILRLPGPFAWLTGHIGIHHIHHLAPRVPSYRLAECDAAHPEFRVGQEFGLAQALADARGDLWDPTHFRLVTFREARRAQAIAN